MLVNADFTRRATVTPDQYHWVASPQPGVERVMFDRVGAERARATSLVRYAPDSCFPRHAHPGGEEILVLSGMFSEGSRNFPAGWYLRNPPGSSHQPCTTEGALIFVKLQQMQDQERKPVRIDTRDPSAWRREGEHEVCDLFFSQFEQVSLRRLPGDTVLFDATRGGGAEMLVLTGTVVEADRSYGQGTWLRLPPGEPVTMRAGADGLACYLKTGHLVQPMHLDEGMAKA